MSTEERVETASERRARELLRAWDVQMDGSKAVSITALDFPRISLGRLSADQLHRARVAIAATIDAACEEATNSRDHEIASLTREVERSRAMREAEAVAQKTTLEGLVGHKVGFCGVDNNTIVLRVHGKLRAFEVREDEQDGYRSLLDEVREVPLADTIHFGKPIADVVVGKVECFVDFTGYTLVDDSGHTWLKAGTDYRDEYYPCFAFDYTPPERPVATEALPRWVPVGESLPGPDDLVMVSTAKGDVCACTYCPGYDDDEPGRWTAGDWPIYDVVAWMPLPKPYEAP